MFSMSCDDSFWLFDLWDLYDMGELMMDLWMELLEGGDVISA